mmetsp:Transcript_28771/g.52582  ORF Transcript_28771/g.52582 Transcript_28771/m.52582 type:complete len:273 (-) Transcript_28771:765-1583(-)
MFTMMTTTRQSLFLQFIVILGIMTTIITSFSPPRDHGRRAVAVVSVVATTTTTSSPSSSSLVALHATTATGTAMTSSSSSPSSSLSSSSSRRAVTVTTTTTTAEVRNRESLVRSVRTMKEYEAFVLEERDKLVIVRFHAPWCRVCKATNIAYERYATKLQTSHPHQIKFLSVTLDGSDDTNELKNSLSKNHGLDVRKVPMAMLYHPSLVASSPSESSSSKEEEYQVSSQGIFGKVNLNRRMLSMLRHNVELYLKGGGGDVGLISLLDGLQLL